MYVRKLLSLFAAFLFFGSLFAQDIHFTQFYMAPLTLNPALAGKFEGTVRLGGIYRSQWSSVLGSGDQYSTPSAYADAPIIRGFRKRDWVGLGLAFLQDNAGAGNYRKTMSRIGGTYHLGLDKKGNSVLSVGVQWGGVNSKADWDKFKFEDGFKPGETELQYKPGNSQDYASNKNNDKKTYNDVVGGIVLSSRLNKRMDFNIGFAMFHITKPEYGILADSLGSKPKLPNRPLIHGQFNIQMNDKFTLSPAFQYQTIAGQDEIQLQALGGYLMDAEKEITLNFGIGYRLRDAISPIVGVKYKALTVGAAYDINTSDLNAYSNYRGGFEIAANYIIRIYKPAIIKPKVLCPRF